MIGIGILAFDRPNYLRRLLASLEAQTDLRGCDFHLFLDGAVNPASGIRYAEQANIDKCARIFERSKLPNKTAHIRDHNANIGIASFEATEMLASTYERVMQMEDDIVLSPHWFRLARVLWNELEAHPDVYSFNPAYRRAHRKEIDAQFVGSVTYGWNHMWCECFTADRWARIRDEYLEYHALICEADYLERFEGPVAELYARKGMRPGLARSQDGGREMAIRGAGMRRAMPAVNRAIGTGQHGIHFTPKVFADMGFENQTPFVFADDATREGFVWDD